MKAVGICPGSCGELIQGFINGRELLVSYPINLFSHAVLRETLKWCKKQGRPKARKALEQSFISLGLPVEETHNIEISIMSDIPQGRGMASSTADIVAVVRAASSLVGKDLTPNQIADIALSIEPTDSIVFEGLTLFDPLYGEVREFLGEVPPLEVLVLEPRETIDTIEFRKKDYSKIKKKKQHELERALRLLKQGINNKDLFKIGEAAVISSLANEDVIKKPNLEPIIQCALKVGAIGVNIAHSGSVVGVILNPNAVDSKEVESSLRERKLLTPYDKVYKCKMITGRNLNGQRNFDSGSW